MSPSPNICGSKIISLSLNVACLTGVQRGGRAREKRERGIIQDAFCENIFCIFGDFSSLLVQDSELTKSLSDLQPYSTHPLKMILVVLTQSRNKVERGDQALLEHIPSVLSLRNSL